MLHYALLCSYLMVCYVSVRYICYVMKWYVILCDGMLINQSMPHTVSSGSYYNMLCYDMSCYRIWCCLNTIRLEVVNIWIDFPKLLWFHLRNAVLWDWKLRDLTPWSATRFRIHSGKIYSLIVIQAFRTQTLKHHWTTTLSDYTSSGSAGGSKKIQ